MKLKAYLLRAVCFAGLAVAAGAVTAPANAATTFALTGISSTTNGIDDSDVANIGGSSFGSNLTLTGSKLVQADAYYDSTQSSVTGYHPTLTTTTGNAFTESYTFTLSTASTVSFLLNSSPTQSVVFTSASLGATTYTPVGGATTAIAFNTGTLNTGTYTFVFSGLDKTQGTVGVTGSSTVSPVPLPGALVLFGSGLLGLGGVARRRKMAKAAKVAVVAALPLALLAVAPSAQASTIAITDNVGTITSTNPLHGALTESSKSSVTVGKVTKTATANEAIVASYDFALTSKENLQVTLTPPAVSPSLPTGTSYALYNGATLIAPTKTSTETSQGVTSLIESFSNLSASTNYVLKIVTTFQKNTQITISGTVSAVPVPGALVLFGSGLAGLGLARRRRRLAA